MTNQQIAAQRMLEKEKAEGFILAYDLERDGAAVLTVDGWMFWPYQA